MQNYNRHMNTYDFIYKFIFCYLKITTDDSFVYGINYADYDESIECNCNCDFDSDYAIYHGNLTDKNSDRNWKKYIDAKNLSLKVAKQLEEYFDGKSIQFDVPLCIRGTSFQKKVWTELLNIPYGETRSYGEIAKAIGNPKASRAVGMANNRNPISIIIPCHRVIGSKGKLVGYGGGLEMKEKLLDLENASYYK